MGESYEVQSVEPVRLGKAGHERRSHPWAASIIDLFITDTTEYTE